MKESTDQRLRFLATRREAPALTGQMVETVRRMIYWQFPKDYGTRRAETHVAMTDCYLDSIIDAIDRRIAY